MCPLSFVLGSWLLCLGVSVAARHYCRCQRPVVLAYRCVLHLNFSYGLSVAICSLLPVQARAANLFIASWNALPSPTQGAKSRQNRSFAEYFFAAPGRGRSGSVEFVFFRTLQLRSRFDLARLP